MKMASIALSLYAITLVDRDSALYVRDLSSRLTDYVLNWSSSEIQEVKVWEAAHVLSSERSWVPF